MKTKLFKISRKQLDKKIIKLAGETIRKGGLVAFPTETVYGLGANALDETAVKKIFEAKGRPQDNPLIVHISDEKMLKNLVKEIPEKAKRLMSLFWPGPLTLIFKASKKVPRVVTAGLSTVAIRMPSDEIALKLIKEARVPIAAPSANLSGKPSGTTGKHVANDFKGKVELILDGGKVEVGLESTVLDLTSKIPTILRPGKVTEEELRNVLGKVTTKTKAGKVAKSPGMKYKHYSPNAKVILAKKEFFPKLRKKYSGKKIFEITAERGLEKFAQDLFYNFRKADKLGADIIIVEAVEEKGLGTAIMNRLKKAASEVVI